MHGREFSFSGRFDPEGWRDTETYLYGVDLFNHRYWWEAHAAWEVLWRAAGDAPTVSLLRGLILLAAALLKLRGGEARGAEILRGRSLRELERVLRSGRRRHLGLDLPGLAAEVERLSERGAEDPPVLVLYSP